MAKIRKLGTTYYARIRMPKEAEKTEKCVNLGTKSELVANQRMEEITLYENDIKSGENIIFSWQANDGMAKLKKLTLGECLDQYLKYRKNDLDNPLRESSHYQIKICLKRVEKLFGSDFNISLFNQKHLLELKNHFSENKQIASTNSILRFFYTFWRWLHKNNYKVQKLELKLLKDIEHKPKYLSNEEFKKILNELDDDMAKIFRFYRDTGVRLSEPMWAHLENNFMIVPPERSKNHQEREIPLTDEQVEVLKFIQSKYRHMSDLKNPKKNCAVFSIKFFNVCKKLNIKGKKFHSLRHTFAVRTYLSTRDLYYTARMLGHKDVSTTLIYAKFSLKRLAEDFPDLVSNNDGKINFIGHGKEKNLGDSNFRF